MFKLLTRDADRKEYMENRKEEVRKDAAYSLNLFFLHKNAKVLSSWHLPEPTTTDTDTEQPPLDELQLKFLQLTKPIRFVRGGQGFVYSVFDPRTRHHFALKMKLREGRCKAAWHMDEREHHVLTVIRHAFIVTMHNFFITEEAVFLNMEFLDGGCLWSHVAYNGLFPEQPAAYYTACILEALVYLHKLGIVYRDLKAENIVLDWNRRPRLIDFCMAKFLEKDASGELQDPCGATSYAYTGYLAPEMYLCPEKADQKVDIWGLGYLLLQMHLGFGVFKHLPWEQTPGKHLCKNWKLQLPTDTRMSPKYAAIVHSILCQQPQERPTLAEIQNHPFLSSIDWGSLYSQMGPNLKTIHFIPMRQTEYLRSRNTHCDISGVAKCNKSNSSHSDDTVINPTTKNISNLRSRSTTRDVWKETNHRQFEARYTALTRPEPKLLDSFSFTVGNLDIPK